MIRRKTSAIVESGILAAIAVIFTLIGNYIPVLDVIVSVWWPLPILSLIHILTLPTIYSV